MTLTAPPSPVRRPVPAIAAAIAVAAVLGLGVFVLGRLARSTTVAMVVTTIWFLLVAAVVLLVARRQRSLFLPMAAGYALVGALVGVLIGRPLLFDNTVDEQVVAVSGSTAEQPAAEQPPAEGEQPAGGEQPAEGEQPAAEANVAVAAGDFEPIAHPGSGRATVVRLGEGGHVLTLTDFSTDNGPDLRVYLVPGAPPDGSAAGFVDLGALKGNRGNQQYEIPENVDPARFGSVVIWCRAFSVGFTRAVLSP